MSALTVIVSIWTMVALCAILFIRGATARVERPSAAPFGKPLAKPFAATQEQPARFSIAE